MKTTSNKKILDLVSRLSQIIEARKISEAEEKTIKSELKGIMSQFETNVLGAGDYVMVISDRTRTEVNKDMVKELLGSKYEECLTKSQYQIFEVKKA